MAGAVRGLMGVVLAAGLPLLVGLSVQGGSVAAATPAIKSQARLVLNAGAATPLAAGALNPASLGRVYAVGRYSVPVVPVSLNSGVSAVAAGEEHGLAIKGGAVVAWGENDWGQSQVPPKATAGVTDVAASGSTSYAVSNGAVVAWGRNDKSQRDVPGEALSGVEAVSAGPGYALALKSGRVIAWGLDPIYAERPTAVDVPPEALSGVTAISAGLCHALALKGDQAIAWGNCVYSDDGESVVPPEARSGIVAVAAGYRHSLALKGDRVIGWGSNEDGWGNYVGQANVPPEAQSGVVAIAAGFEYSVALKADGRIVVWGRVTGSLAAIPGDLQGHAFTVSAGPSWLLAVAAGSVPSPPSGVTAIAGDESASVSWRAPTSAGSSAIAAYTATASPGGKTCTWSYGPLTCEVVGLSNGVTYSFTVTATNAEGTSLASSPSDSVVPGRAPSAPTDVVATAGNGSATVSWSAPESTGGLAVNLYTVTSLPGGRTCSTSGELTCVIAGLTNGTAVTFVVTATNSAGVSPASAPSPPVTPFGGTISNTVAPVISGMPKVGKRLRASPGSWMPVPDKYVFTWTYGNQTIVGKNQLVVPRAAKRKTIKLTVTAIKRGYQDGQAIAKIRIR